MSQDDYTTETYNGYTIRVQVDEDATHPFDDMCMFGTFLSTFRNLRSTDDAPTHLVQECQGFESLVKTISKRYGPALVLKVRGYCHGGTTVRVMDTPSGQFACPFDSGWAGVIYATHKEIREKFRVKKVSKKVLDEARSILKMEIGLLDQYLNGEMYGYIIEDEHGEEVDSCWGYYGLECCLTEAREAVDYEKSLREAQEVVS